MTDDPDRTRTSQPKRRRTVKEDDQAAGNGSDTRRRTSNARTSNVKSSSSKPSARTIINRMREQFGEITGRDAETVSALNPTEDGWELNVEVVELARIPDTTSVMATYLVRLDSDGDFVGYERLKRYTRGQTEL